MVKAVPNNRQLFQGAFKNCSSVFNNWSSFISGFITLSLYTHIPKPTICYENSGYGELCSLRQLLDRDLESQRFQLTDEPRSLHLDVLAVEVVAPKLSIARPALQHMVDDHEQAVPHRRQR